jgi:hypothetical protein
VGAVMKKGVRVVNWKRLDEYGHVSRRAIALCGLVVFIGVLLWSPSQVMAEGAASGVSAGFSLKDDPGKALDIYLDGRLAARYMYAHDNSTPERLHETYKPYLHVFDAQGQTPITKGPGGQYTHHRGIFIGWNKILFKGKRYDRWHMKGGEIIHRDFLQKAGSSRKAVFTSLTHWNDEAGQAIIQEERTMTFRRTRGPARLMIDFQAKLKAPNGDVFLDGDPEHAGIQYRPADEVVRAETVYVFPREKANPKQDLDYPWVGETYTLNGKRHSVVQMNHPDNPSGTKYSAYRDYGRFGAFFTKEIKAGGTLTVQYRFLIADGEMPATKQIQRHWDRFTGQQAASPAPKTTSVASVPKKAKKKTKPKKTEL